MIEVLKFSATWCGPCRVLASNLTGVSGITNVDIDKDMGLAKEHNVRSVPLMIFKVDGKEVHRQVGVISKDQYESLLIELGNDVKWDNK